MKYHIITFGCQMNKSDSERIATIFESKGYLPASKVNEADLIVVNMCSVRQSAVDRVFGISQKLTQLKTQKSKVKTVLTGCILKKDKRKFREIFDSIWDTRNYFEVPPKCQSKTLAYVPISNGCNNFCSYCVVPFTRGPLICRDHNEILEEVKNVVKKGFKEVWLLGQNVNSYEVQRKTDAKPNAKQTRKINFPQLLKMINAIPGNFLIRFMSPHPADFSEELIDVMANSEKVAKYLHLPVQSGDNEILERMNRPYTVEQYKSLVKKIRKKIPNINLSTDVIVGFPGETKKQFENTVKLFKEIKFNIAYFAKYSPRPGTAAWQMEDDVSLAEKKKREKILREIIEKQHLPR